MTDISRKRSRRRWLLPGLVLALAGVFAVWILLRPSGAVDTPSERPGDIVLRLNCGGPSLGEPGTAGYWESDAAYAQGGRLHGYRRQVETEGVANAGPMALYQTVRRSNHYYVFSGLEPGRYTVRLHFYDGGRNPQRSMDYTINGVKVLDGFNIKVEAGQEHRAVVREFVTEVRHDLRILASEDDGVDVFEAGLEILRGGATPSPAAPDPEIPYVKIKGQAGSDAPVPDDLPWLRRRCGDGALAYSADGMIFLVELTDGETREIGSGTGVEFSPDGTKLAWIDDGVVKGRLRKGDESVHPIIEGARKASGVHWLGNEALVLEVKNGERTGWHRVGLDGRNLEPIPELDALGSGINETDVKQCADGVWSYVTQWQWATSDGRSGDLDGRCSVSLSPDGLSATILVPGHRRCHLQAIREGGEAGWLSWLFAEGFDNHRWSSNDPRFVVCLDEGSMGMAVMMTDGSYATRMGKPGRNGAQMYGDFTVGSGEGGVWEIQ